MLFYDYPPDPDQFDQLMRKREFIQHRMTQRNPNDFEPEELERIMKEECAPKEFFQLQPHQNFLREYMRPRTPYRSMLLFHGLGSGKTMSAISVAENFKEFTYQRGTKIFILGSDTSKDAFINELHSKIGYSSTKHIRKYYQMMGYNEFSNHVNRSSASTRSLLAQPGIQKLRNKNVSNALIIVDEAHNVIPREGKQKEAFEALRMVIKRSKNVRLLLLTGTPVFDSPDEITWLLYLLMLNDGKITEQDEKMMNERKLRLFNDGDDNNEFTESGEDFLNRARGYVSYVEGKNPFTFPKRIDMGGLINGVLESIKVVRCWMSTHQVAGYVSALSKDYEDKHTWGLKLNSQYASMIVYPDGSFGKEGYEKYKTQMDFLRKANLKEYSAKLWTLLNEIEKTVKGTIFIHSVYVNENGIDIIQRMLDANNYRGRYRTIIGSTSKRNKEYFRELFSSDANRDGDHIKILIGSTVVSEGMNLRNVAKVFIMEPHFNISRIEQAIGRAIRHCSHWTLEPERRVVRVYRMVGSVVKSKREPLKQFATQHDDINTEVYSNRTTDELMYKIAEGKLQKSQKIQNKLKQNALDYQMMLLSEQQRQDIIVDESTYDFARNVYRMAQIKAYIKTLFQRNTAWTLDDIVEATLDKFIPESELERDEMQEQIPLVLHNIVIEHEPVRNKFNRDGYVIYRGRYYIFNIFGQPETMSLARRNLPEPVLITDGDISHFLKTDPRIQKGQEQQQKSQTTATATTKTTDTTKIPESEIRREIKNIRKRMDREGIPKDQQFIGCNKRLTGDFAIIKPPANDSDFSMTGTVCTKASNVFPVSELIRVAEKLGIGRKEHTDIELRFEYEIVEDNKGKPTLKNYNKQKENKSIKEYICNLIRQKLIESGNFVQQCPEGRKK